MLLIFLLSFPLVLRWTGTLSFYGIPLQSPEHTRGILNLCLVLIVFLWTCFAIAFIGIRRTGKIAWQGVIGGRWDRWQSILSDLGIAMGTLVLMGVIGNVSNVVFGPLQQDSPTFRAMVAQNFIEAVAFLASALTAGFVEEFIFRGYLQRQFQALCGSTVIASVLQISVFTFGHFYQGWLRLVPVLLIATLLTSVALWRKNLIPGMIAHGAGNGLVAFQYFFKHL
jgi:membrane protease YdiL (CAAX protease family)